MTLPATYLQMTSTISKDAELRMELAEQAMPCLLYTSPSP